MLIRPNDVKLKKKQRKINTEILDLKQKLQSASKSVVLSNREIRLLRYLDLTDDEKEKVKGSHKVAKKLEKLENMGQDKNFSDSDEELECIEHDYASLDSMPSDNSLNGPLSLNNNFSPKSSEPPSFIESIHLIDDILHNKTMEPEDRIDKIEALLSMAISMPPDQTEISFECSDGLAIREIIEQNR